MPDVSCGGGSLRPVTALAVAGLAATVLAGCGSGDSTAAKTPSAPISAAGAPTPGSEAPAAPAAPGAPSTPAAPDRCAVNLTAPAIARAVSELPRDPRSKQPWSPEPVAGNYSECADLSAVIARANTNAAHPSTRAVLFHLGQYVPQAAPDTYGFNGIDTAACTPDTVVLRNASGIAGLNGVVRFHWNGTGVEILGNTAG